MRTFRDRWALNVLIISLLNRHLTAIIPVIQKQYWFDSNWSWYWNNKCIAKEFDRLCSTVSNNLKKKTAKIYYKQSDCLQRSKKSVKNSSKWSKKCVFVYIYELKLFSIYWIKIKTNFGAERNISRKLFAQALFSYGMT